MKKTVFSYHFLYLVNSVSNKGLTKEPRGEGEIACQTGDIFEDAGKTSLKSVSIHIGIR